MLTETSKFAGSKKLNGLWSRQNSCGVFGSCMAILRYRVVQTHTNDILLVLQLVVRVHHPGSVEHDTHARIGHALGGATAH